MDWRDIPCHSALRGARHLHGRLGPQRGGSFRPTRRVFGHEAWRPMARDRRSDAGEQDRQQYTSVRSRRLGNTAGGNRTAVGHRWGSASRAELCDVEAAALGGLRGKRHRSHGVAAFRRRPVGRSARACAGPRAWHVDGDTRRTSAILVGFAPHEREPPQQDLHREDASRYAKVTGHNFVALESERGHPVVGGGKVERVSGLSGPD
mmetsp:Transcript_24763/g.69069  ORF Transcript_24763/g.69069 Transcript_24763/m.69069 type:complete len:206 (-) Transcript_24763:1830-2447(-)